MKTVGARCVDYNLARIAQPAVGIEAATKDLSRLCASIRFDSLDWRPTGLSPKGWKALHFGRDRVACPGVK